MDPHPLPNPPRPITTTTTTTQQTNQQDSRLVHREGNADQLVWFQLGVPRVFALDVLLEAYGADLMVEGAWVGWGVWCMVLCGFVGLRVWFARCSSRLYSTPTHPTIEPSDGSVVIVGQSVTATHPPDRPLKEVPEPPKGLFGWRVELRDFKVQHKDAIVS